MRHVHFVTLALAPVGCGGGSSGNPVQKCDDLLEALCTRVQTCGEQLTGTVAPATFHKDCLDAQKAELDCSKAMSVDPSYDTCITELRTFSCNVFVTLDADQNITSVNPPASCMGVILGP